MVPGKDDSQAGRIHEILSTESFRCRNAMNNDPALLAQVVGCWCGSCYSTFFVAWHTCSRSFQLHMVLKVAKHVKSVLSAIFPIQMHHDCLPALPPAEWQEQPQMLLISRVVKRAETCPACPDTEDSKSATVSYRYTDP